MSQPTRRRLLRALAGVATSLCLAGTAGCSKREDPTGASPPSGPALYGEVHGPASTAIPRARPFVATTAAWREAAFACVQTELSPATLFRSTSRYLGLFTGLGEAGLGAPAFAAINTPTGPRVFRNGQRLDVRWMEENWVLVWFAGARGWTNWDSPWAVYLQHKPVSARLDADGLHLEFPQAAGDVVVLPLYGYFKPLPPGRDLLTAQALPGRNVKTREWTNGLPREPLMRVKYWARATREFPLYCEESFSVDRGRDTVTMRQRFHWHPIHDEWRTPHLKVAPISPTLALAALDKGFPVSFSKPVRDFEIATPYGPFMGAENVDEFDTTFRVLRYVHETEAPAAEAVGQSRAPGADGKAARGPANDPLARAAWERLQAVARQTFREAAGPQQIGAGLAAAGWWARTLPYLEEPARGLVLASLRRSFREQVLVPERLRSFEDPKGSGRVLRSLVTPRAPSGTALAELVAANAGVLEALWTYAHFSGDWALVRERWELVKRLSLAIPDASWAGFGRHGAAPSGDPAAACLTLARLAYRAADLDTYHYACYLFARELVHHHVKQRGAAWFRQHQPWHSMTPLAAGVRPSHVEGDAAGWQFGDPRDSASSDGGPAGSRWMRFNDPDVGRFYRDHLRAEVKQELDRLQSRLSPGQWAVNDPEDRPSLVQLRSLLLNESPAELARMAAPEQFAGTPAGVAASCLAMLRAAQPVRYQRLIPVASPSPFVAGLERDVPGPNPGLTHAMRFMAGAASLVSSQPAWPRIAWPRWTTATGQPWTFGQVAPVRRGSPAAAEAAPLNWNCQALIYPPP